MKEARAGLARFEEVARLSGGKVPSKAELDGSRATLARAIADEASARASVADAQAALSTDQTNLSKASIVAPTDGVVLTRNVDPGNAVAASLQAVTLFTVAEDLTQLRLWVYVDEADVGAVKVGQNATFTVSAYPDPPVSRAHHARGLRLDHHRQRRHLPDLPRRGQRRSEPAPGHDGHRYHHRDAAPRRTAGTQHRTALHTHRGGNRQQTKRVSASACCRACPGTTHPQVGRRRCQYSSGQTSLGAARWPGGVRGRDARHQRRPHDRDHRRRPASRHAGHHRSEGARQRNERRRSSSCAASPSATAAAWPN